MLWKRKQWNDTLQKGYPHIVIDNFLDEETALKLYDECINGAPRGGWTNFTRAGSNMEEYNDLVYCEKGHKITYDLMHSGEMCYELEQLTDMVGLMPDPHLVGAGYSRFKPGSDLKPHYDFNWNDRLKLHRRLSCFLYLTPEWKDEYGGHIQFWDGNPNENKKAKIATEIAPLFNRLVIFGNLVKGPVHSVKPVKAPKELQRTSIRWFYYQSNSTYNPDDPPHRSIYKTNEYTHTKLYEDE